MEKGFAVSGGLPHRGYRGTSLIRTPPPQDLTVGPCPGPYGGPREGQFLMSEVMQEVEIESIRQMLARAAEIRHSD